MFILKATHKIAYDNTLIGTVEFFKPKSVFSNYSLIINKSMKVHCERYDW